MKGQIDLLALFPETKGIYIFDIDGTLTIVGDRVKRVQGEEKDWDAFYDEAEKDLPKYPVIKVMDSLLLQGYGVVLLTGRPERIRWSTLDFLGRNTMFVQLSGREHLFASDKQALASEKLFMPATRDWTPDYKFKRKWLHSLTQASREKILGVFEDRQRVCEMWREEGVICFQVDEGKY